jgi:hypothetical protein
VKLNIPSHADLSKAPKKTPALAALEQKVKEGGFMKEGY